MVEINGFDVPISIHLVLGIIPATIHSIPIPITTIHLHPLLNSVHLCFLSNSNGTKRQFDVYIVNRSINGKDGSSNHNEFFPALKSYDDLI